MSTIGGDGPPRGRTEQHLCLGIKGDRIRPRYIFSTMDADAKRTKQNQEKSEGVARR